MSSGAKDGAHITPGGRLTRGLMHGSVLKESHHIVTANGLTTELHRTDWGILGDLRQVIHVALHAGALSAWHLHRRQTDHLLALSGHLRVALYDGREDSPSRGQVDIHHLAGARPQLLVIPPGVWHGIQCLGAEAASFVNYFDREYDHADPDEYRLPADTDEIPYRFPR